MKKAAFNIKNLICEYKPDVPTLRLHHLELPAGHLIFLIGKSGIGKSTFIETLGLMNRTIARRPDTSILFSPDGEQEYEMKESWQLPNGQLSEFRRRYFSFIFQNTNLMPNFTSGENMMVSLLIEGRSFADAKKEVLAMMDRLSLGRGVFDKKVTEISGGQRQRLAFVRAVTANFTVLFGDEPTGNLDRNTSNELMAILKEQITDRGKTGIIVSHDLILAERFADMIVPITLDSKDQSIVSGGVDASNILYRKEGIWKNAAGNPLKDTLPFLNQFLSFAEN